MPPWRGAGSRSSVQHPLAERLEGGSSISLPFEQLQARNLPFRLPITPREDQARLNCLNVLPDAVGKGMKILDWTRQDRGKPGVELASCAGAHHLGKLLDELVSQSYFFMDLTELFKRVLLSCCQLFRPTKKKPPGLS